MLLELFGNTSGISRFSLAFASESTLSVSYQKLLLQISDAPQAKITKVGFSLHLSPRFAFSGEMNAVYSFPELKNIGVVQAFDQPLSLFETGDFLVLHFKDKLVSFRNAQQQFAAPVSTSCACAYRDGVIAAYSNRISTFSSNLTQLGSFEVQLGVQESICQLCAYKNTIVLLTTGSRVLVGEYGESSFMEVFKDEQISQLELGPYINGLVVALIGGQKLQVIRISPNGSGVKMCHNHVFADTVKSFKFARNLQDAVFLRNVNCLGVAAADKVYAVCPDDCDIFKQPTAFRDVVDEYTKLRALYDKMNASQPETREFIYNVELACEIQRGDDELKLSISSASYLIYCDVEFPAGLYLQGGQFDCISPRVVRVLNRDRVTLQFGFLPGYRYYAKNEFRISAVSDSYVNGVYVLRIDEFFTFQPISKLPKVPVFVYATVDEFLPNCTVSAPADFFQCETRDGVSYIKSSSLTTVEGFLDAFSQRRGLQMQINQEGFLARLSAFCKVFKARKCDFEQWKLTSDIELWMKAQNRKVDMIAVSRGLGLIQSGLWGSTEMGAARIRQALNL